MIADSTGQERKNPVNDCTGEKLQMVDSVHQLMLHSAWRCLIVIGQRVNLVHIGMVDRCRHQLECAAVFKFVRKPIRMKTPHGYIRYKNDEHRKREIFCE
ncbi:MAG: hypothetical protein ACYDDT_12680 [Sulfuricella sp.]